MQTTPTGGGTPSPNVLGAFGLALASGLNASLPLLLIGVLGRLGLITLAPPFDALASPMAITGFLGLAAIEMLGDKVPFLDAKLHALLLPASITAGAILFGTQTHAVAHTDPGLATVMAVIIGGGTAGITHTARATIRPFTHLAVVGPLVSFGEDMTAGTLTMSALFAPWLIPFIVLAMLGTLVVLLRFLYRRVRIHVWPRLRSFIAWIRESLGQSSFGGPFSSGGSDGGGMSVDGYDTVESVPAHGWGGVDEPQDQPRQRRRPRSAGRAASRRPAQSPRAWTDEDTGDGWAADPSVAVFTGDWGELVPEPVSPNGRRGRSTGQRRSLR